MIQNHVRWPLLSFSAALLAACGGGSSGDGPGTSQPQSQSGTVSMMVSDASTEDWATIGVKLVSVALVPQGGGSNITVYSAPSPAPTLNLAQLDDIAELLGQVSVPAGTYSGAVITLSANASDVLLTVAADPEAGFSAPGGTTIAAGAIQVQHTQGSGASLTVPVDVTFGSPLTVGANATSALNLEFDLAQPAFLVGYVPAAGGSAAWAVDFTTAVRDRPVKDMRGVLLRHAYGTVNTIAADNGSITIAKVYPTLPVATPETAVSTTQTFQILADATNGTLFYDVDAGTKTLIKDFAAQGSLVGKSVRVAARYQQNGTLVATRIWASSQFSSVWLSPEGHVLHVDPTHNTIAVANESGGAQVLSVDGNTQFFFRAPADAQSDLTPIGTGTGFLANHNLLRGFKVHASVVDPLATPLVAQSVDIEVARFDGRIVSPASSSFGYSRQFFTASDDYQVTLDYIAGSSANGSDGAGTAVNGYSWWNFAYPTQVTSGSGAIASFVAATSDSVNFGGSVGAVPSRGATLAVWNDPANPTGWSAAQTVLLPSLAPLGVVTNPLSNNQFTVMAVGGAVPVPVTVSTTAGSATLVYQVDCTNGRITVTAVDITAANGLSTVTAGLGVGTPVKAYGIPQADGTLKAYALAYFTGAPPAQ